MDGILNYPDSNSAWIMGWSHKNVFFTSKDGYTLNSDACVILHYPHKELTIGIAKPYLKMDLREMDWKPPLVKVGFLL